MPHPEPPIERPFQMQILRPDELLDAAQTLLADHDVGLGDTPSAHGRMQCAYALRDADGKLSVRYIVSQGANRPWGIWSADAASGSLPSLANVLPLLGWYEREIQDLYGITFTDHPEPYPLVLHEGFIPSKPPLQTGFDPKAEPIHGHAEPFAEANMVGRDIQRLPFGPIRADVVESAQFVFHYIGEGILHYHPRLSYKHRAMEARFEGVPISTACVLAERVSGVDSVAHVLAFSQAMEAALGWQAPLRAQVWRVILAELERLYNHLHYFGHLAKTTTLKVAEAEGIWLEEQVKQINGRLTGSRFLRSVIVPGGLRRDLDATGLSADLNALQPQIEDYLNTLANTRSYLDRLLTTGVLPRQVAFDQGATGPIERASDLDRDLRRDHGYALYPDLQFAVPTATEGDADARARVRDQEIRQSLHLIRQALNQLEPGAIRRTESTIDPAIDGMGLGWAEAVRGGLIYAVHWDVKAERLTRVKIKEPSFSNWRVFPFTVYDSNMMDYAINEASFGLSVAGADR